MNPKLTPLIAALLAGLVSMPLLASDGDAALQVDADRWEADQSREISVFSGNVVMAKGTIRIEADEARIKATDGKVNFGTIIGSPATFEQTPDDAPAIRGRADRIEYDAANEIVILTGQAWVRQGNDEFSGETIRYDLVQEKVLATGSDKTPQRVRIIFTPRGDGNAKPAEQQEATAVPAESATQAAPEPDTESETETENR